MTDELYPQGPEDGTNRNMVFDSECRMVNDPGGNARKIILA